jgi:hypothetical protein
MKGYTAMRKEYALAYVADVQYARLGAGEIHGADMAPSAMTVTMLKKVQAITRYYTYHHVTNILIIGLDAEGKRGPSHRKQSRDGSSVEGCPCVRQAGSASRTCVWRGVAGRSR